MRNVDYNKEELLPTNDWVFKRIYGREGSERITEDFIKTFLDLDVKLEKLENEKTMDVDITSEKAGRLDILATTVTGTRINIEMQMWNLKDIKERLSYYGCELYAGSMKKGIKYKDVKKSISVMIVTGEISSYKEYDDFRFKYNIREENYHDLLLTNNLEFYIISLEKIKKQIAEGRIKDKEKIAIWTKFLLTPQELKEEEMSENKEVKEANELYNEFLMDENERLNAVKRHIYMMDMNSLRNEGREEGLMEGEKNKAKEIAKKLLEENISLEIIIKTTGLTKEEIEELKEN